MAFQSEFSEVLEVICTVETDCDHHNFVKRLYMDCESPVACNQAMRYLGVIVSVINGRKLKSNVRVYCTTPTLHC